MVHITGCSDKKPLNDKKAEIAATVISALLTVPYQCYPNPEDYEVVNCSDFKTMCALADQYTSALNTCVLSQTQGYVYYEKEDGNFLETPPGARLFNYINYFHSNYIETGIEELLLEPVKDNQNLYHFTVRLSLTGNEGKIIKEFAGTVQFKANTELINYFDLRGDFGTVDQ